jgi:HEAT repeat protein
MTFRRWYLRRKFGVRKVGAFARSLTSKEHREVAAEMARAHAFHIDGNVVGLIHMLDSDLRGRSDASIIRAHAAGRLGRLGDPRAIPYLMEMRDDPEEQVRASVIRALGRLKAKEAEGLLLETLDDPSPLLRDAAVSALGHIGAVDAIPRLRKRLDSELDPEVRLNTVEALVILGDESARARVSEALSMVHVRTRELPRYQALREAAETCAPLTPWVSGWESNPQI